MKTYQKNEISRKNAIFLKQTENCGYLSSEFVEEGRLPESIPDKSEYPNIILSCDRDRGGWVGCRIWYIQKIQIAGFRAASMRSRRKEGFFATDRMYNELGKTFVESESWSQEPSMNNIAEYFSGIGSPYTWVTKTCHVMRLLHCIIVYFPGIKM